MPRMRILNTSEQTGIERPPVFTSSERKQHFDFSQPVLDMAEGLRGKTNQVGFLLAYGYFRATKRFFLPHDFYARDIDSVIVNPGVKRVNVPVQNRTHGLI